MKAKCYYKDGTCLEGRLGDIFNNKDQSKILHRENGPTIETDYGTKYWCLNGKYHREGGPAVEYVDGTNHWYQNGLLHREDGPAIEYGSGTKEWYLNGKRHREDGPAIEYENGSTEWYLHDKLHREGGPAVEWTDKTKHWYLNDKLHREDGPAIESVHKLSWWLSQKEYSEEDFNSLLKEIDSLEPMIGLTDSREWVRNRWKKKLNESALDCHHCNEGVVWLGDDDGGGPGECPKCHGEGFLICSECGGGG